MILLNFSLGGLFGSAYNWIFEFVYSISPAYSLGISIILFTLIIKLVLLPLSIKQQKSALQMQKMQPLIKQIQDKYKDKKDMESQQQLGTEIQALYKEHKANPIAGCLLPFLQIPILYALFGVLKTAHTHITKISTIYTELTNQVLNVPEYNAILTNLGKAKKLPEVDYTIVDNIKNLFTTLTTADWNALIGDITEYIDVDKFNALISQKSLIENFFTINLTNPPTLTTISVLLPIITVALTFFSMKSAFKDQDVENMDESSKAMVKNMSSMNIFIIVLVFISSMSFPAGLSLYWSLSTLIQIIQQKLIKKYIK